jgi:outer membrane protein TolC
VPQNSQLLGNPRGPHMLSYFLMAGLVGGVLVNIASGAQSSSSEVTPKNLRLKEAIELALNKNPKVAAHKEKIKQNRANKSVARSTFFPNLSFNTGAFTRKDAANHPFALFGASPYNTYNSAMRLNQPLLVFGSGAAVEQADHDTEIARLDAEITARDLTKQVLTAFCNLVLRLRTTDTLERQQKIAQESLQTAQRRERTGLGKMLDVLQLKTQLALLDGRLINARDDVQAAAAELAQHLGEPEIQAFQLINDLKAPDFPSVEKVMDLKNPSLPELEQLHLRLQRNAQQKWILLGSHLPSVVASADYMWNSFTRNDMFTGQTNAWAVGVTLNVPLFSGLSSLHQQRSNNAERAGLEFQRESLRNEVASRQVKARKTVEASQSAILTGQQALKLATDTYEEARRMYRVGLIDFSKLHGAEKDYVEAEQALNQAKFTYIQNLGEYFIASGQNINTLVDLLEASGL